MAEFFSHSFNGVPFTRAYHLPSSIRYLAEASFGNATLIRTAISGSPFVPCSEVIDCGTMYNYSVSRLMPIPMSLLGYVGHLRMISSALVHDDHDTVLILLC